MYFYRSLVILHTKIEPFKLEYHINEKHFEMSHIRHFLIKWGILNGEFHLSIIEYKI